MRQGGYEATCQEIDDILGASSSEETICADAKTQLADQCCYRQCSLCTTGTMRTEWYNVVVFDGLSTTCLGLDYVLRAEQVSEGSYRCSELRGEYVSQCCRASETSCTLCSSDDKLYDMFPDKVVVEPSLDRQTTTTTCSAVSDSLARFETSDQKCTEGKQALFGQCCDLSGVIVSDDGINSTTSAVGGGDGGGGGGGGQATPNPSPSGEGAPANGANEQGPQQPPSSTQTQAIGGEGETTKSPSSRDSDMTSSQQSTTTSPTSSGVWYEPDNNVSWVGVWESQKNNRGFYPGVLHTLILIGCLTIHFIFV